MFGSGSSLSNFAPEDILAQQKLSRQITNFFIDRSFEEVDVPTIVDLSLVEKANSKFSQNVFKVFDETGKTMALRTEITQPLAKMVAGYSSKINFPVRYFYDANVFRFKGSSTDFSKELKQVGVEIFGEETVASDREVLQLLVDTVEHLKIKNSKITITDAKIWHKIFEIYGDPLLSFEQELSALMTDKSFKSVLVKNHTLSLAAQLYKALLENNIVDFKRLCQGHKDLEIFSKSNSISDFEKILALDLSDLKNVESLATNIHFDPLQCPDLKLYTGLHFALYAHGSGSMLALGGRYDNLCKQFGEEISAIGFAFYIKELTELKTNATEKKVLKIAIAKGGLFEKAQEILQEKSFNFAEDHGRKLILNVSSKLNAPFDHVEILLVRGHDVPIYVEHGAADLGIVGLDVVLDSKVSCALLQDLDYGHCRLSVCAKKSLYGKLKDLPKQVRVATTFPNLAKEFFDLKSINSEIINLYGSVELGPLTELSDVIVDLVASGKTLEENNLEELESFLDCSAYLIANKASFKLHTKEFLEF